MTSAKSNFMWPVLIIGVGIVMLMISADVIPEAYGDLLIRAWPVLLLMFGLNVLLAGRIRYANWMILGLSIALVVVIARMAYAERQNEYRDDYTEFWQDNIPLDVGQLMVFIEAKETRVALTHAPIARQIQAEFIGSTESNVEIGMVVENGVATFSVIETRSGILPRLAEVGRGTLNIWLPPDVQIQELHYNGDNGAVTADLSQMMVRSLDLEVDAGNMRLCLPSGSINNPIVGRQVRLNRGNLTVFVPNGVALNIGPGDPNRPVVFVPESSRSRYVFSTTGHLISDDVVNNQFNISLDIITNGAFTLNHQDACQ